MLIRLLVIAIAAASTFLAGCQTTTTEGYLPPDKRSQDRFECPTNPSAPCYVQVDPGKPQWLPENIWANRGGIIQFWLVEGYEFSRPGLTLKVPAEPPPMVCHGSTPRIRTCDVSPRAQPEVKVGYTIRVNGKPDYDPFVWPRN